MLIGRYGDTTGRPYMAAHVHIQSQGIFGEVSFLLDTGADTSVLMPADAIRLAVNYSALFNITESTGMGGVSEDFVEPASIVFRDATCCMSLTFR